MATTPITTASSFTDLLIWRPVAPSARSRASSRTRCPITIENVLLMMKALTTTAMMANASNTEEMMFMNWSKSLWSSAILVSAVTTSNLVWLKADSWIC